MGTDALERIKENVSDLCSALRYAITALEEVRDGRFRYTKGDYEMCARASALLALNRIEVLLLAAAGVDKVGEVR